MKKLVLFLFILCLTAGVANAAIVKQPYLIYPGNNTEMMVLWQVTSTESCTLEWGETTSYGSSVQTSEFGDDHQHMHTITGLTPGQKYYYRVDTGTYWTGSFYAAPSDMATSVSFMAYGDTRNNPNLQDPVNARMITEYTADPALQSLVLFSGDWCDKGRTETSWTHDWFEVGYANMMELRANVPINGAMGNHEITVGTTDDGDLYGKYFPFPEVASHYWSFDYGPAHILIVDQYADGLSGVISSAELAWIESDLAATLKQWKIIVLHAPGWTGSTRTNAQVQTVLQPIMETYGVDIMFGGHEHFYTRCGINGVKQITTGGGGAPLDSPGTNYDYVEEVAGVTHFCAIEIIGGTLYFKAIEDDGTILDSFMLEKGPPDTEAPLPDPMTWATLPYASSSMTVTMVATTATDISEVEYYFACTVGGGNDSGWQSSPTYVDSGLTPEVQYTYQVKAHDRSPYQNETAFSTAESATTPAMQLPGQATNPNPSNGLTDVGVYVNLSWSGDLEATSHDVYFGSVSPPTFITNQSTTVYDPGDMVSSTTYYWRIDEKNAVGTTTGVEWNFTTGLASPPRSHYEFEGDFSNTITGPDATPVGSPSIANDAIKGQVLSLDGAGDYLNCGYDSIGGIETAMTLACWVRTTDLAENDGIIANGYSWRILGGSGGAIKFLDSTLSVGNIAGSTNVADGAWHHIAVTYDSVAEQLVIYADGDVDNSTGCTGLLNTWQGYEFLIGYCTSGTHGYFDGLIEDVRVYDRALPQQEIIALAGGGTPDTDPPTPDPMTWATDPYATSDSSIAMVATTASDASGVMYNFTCTAGGGNDSGWQAGTSYEDTGLSPSTQYTYTVTARDTSGGQNATAASTALSATTDAPDLAAPTPDPMTWATVPYAIGQTSIAMVATTATDASGVEYYFDCTAGSGNDSGWQDSASYTDAGLSPDTQCTYTVQARDKSTNQNATAVSSAETATTDPIPPELPWNDGFESGDVATGGWTISGAITVETDSYAGTYAARTNRVAWLEKAVSTIGFTDIHVKYARKTAGLDAGEDLVVEWSTDGSAWNTLESTLDTSWAYQDMTCAAGADDNAGFRVRFSCAAGNKEYAFVDEVEISGTAGGGEPDVDAPTPDPMTFATAPYSTGETSIAMVATTASDASGVEYYFDCTAGGGNDSGWQDSTNYEDTGLSASTQYTYTVQARDKSVNQNATAVSSAESATTDSPDTTAPTPDPMTFATAPYSTGSSSIAMVATTASDASGVEYYFTCTAGGGNDSTWQDNTNYEDTGLSPDTQYTYTVTARDTSAAQNSTAASSALSATTDAAGAEVYVNDIDMSYYESKSGYYAALATVWIKDTSSTDISGATVSGGWSGATTKGDLSGVTGGDGKVTLESGAVKGGGTYTFTVTGVSASGYTYNASLNNEDSDQVTAP